MSGGRSRALGRRTVFVLVLLAIEYLDEFIWGAREAAWPLIREDLALSYTQIGLLLSVPNLISSLVEPFLGILGDVWKRRALVLGGGCFFGLALILTALSQGFPLILLSFVLFYPASGAFVSLSQATLMDMDPERHEQNMARWTLAGSVGVVLGPLALGGAVALGGGWRGLFLLFAGLAVLLVVLASRFSFSAGREADPAPTAGSLRQGMQGAWEALRRGEVLRWLALLEFSDLMLDVLLGYLALYIVDVAGGSAAEAGLAVAIWSGVGLLGDLLLIPLLERVEGLRYLRWSALIELLLLPAFLLVSPLWAKFLCLGLLGLFNAGWYSILKAQLYRAMPGQSGTVMTVNNLAGLAAGLIPLGLGLAAERLGLGATLWFLLAGPAALLVGIPGARKRGELSG